MQHDTTERARPSRLVAVAESGYERVPASRCGRMRAVLLGTPERGEVAAAGLSFAHSARGMHRDGVCSGGGGFVLLRWPPGLRWAGRS
jgi:hypothetical protein